MQGKVIENRSNEKKESIIEKSELILITGATGFIGPRIVKNLIDRGFINLRCIVRPSSNLSNLNEINNNYPTARIDIISGDLLSQDDCDKITKGVKVIYHLAAAMRDTSFESSYLNNVGVTQNILNGVARHQDLRRFVNVSSLRVYSNSKLRRGELLDETCDIENDLANRGDAYCMAKVMQDELVANYCRDQGISFVTLRPGVVYGPGLKQIHRMVGRGIKLGSRRFFVHLGGSNTIPFSYVDNCADAIVLAGITKGVDGEIFNIVDDDLLTSREFLRLFEKNVHKISSVDLPYQVMYFACFLWEIVSHLSKGRISLRYTRKKCDDLWKGNSYSNLKLKRLLNWEQKISREEALKNYFEYQRTG